MLRSALPHLFVPTLALVEIQVIGLLLFTFTVFGVFTVLGATNGVVFSHLKLALRSAGKRM